MTNLMVMDFSGSIPAEVVDRLIVVGERLHNAAKFPMLKICAFDNELRTLPTYFYPAKFEYMAMCAGGGSDVNRSMTQLQNFDSDAFHAYDTIFIVSDFYCDFSQFVQSAWMKHKSIRFIVTAETEMREADQVLNLELTVLSKTKHTNCTAQTLTGLERVLGIK